MEAPDVIVVGGGAIGVAVAHELARRGASVRVLEREAVGAPSSTSAGNAGLICPSHATPLANPRALREGIVWALRSGSPLKIRPRPAIAPWLLRFALASRPAQARRGGEILRALSLRSLALHAELAASGVETGFERRGILNVYETEELLAHDVREASRAAEAGLEADVLDGAEARALEPALAGRLAGAIHFPTEAHCDPMRYVTALAEAASGLGVDLRSHSPVTELRTRKDRIEGVETPAGFVAAGHVVLAAGAWSGRLARSLRIRLPIEPAKGYHLDLAAAEPVLTRPVFLQEARIVATPLRGRLRLAGTLEFAGFDRSIPARTVESLRQAAARTLTGVSPLNLKGTWAGLRPCSSDGLPILGRPEAWENLHFATAHGMLGLTLSPVTAEIITGLILGEPLTHDIARLSPDRFHGIVNARR
jgi:D-amino-acid dehydrogenase